MHATVSKGLVTHTQPLAKGKNKPPLCVVKGRGRGRCHSKVDGGEVHAHCCRCSLCIVSPVAVSVQSRSCKSLLIETIKLLRYIWRLDGSTSVEGCRQ